MVAEVAGLRRAVPLEPEVRPACNWTVSGRAITRLFELFTAMALIALSACSWITTGEPSKASAEVLGTRIFVQQSGQPALQRVEFDAPHAGKATLRLANGAKLDARPQERVTSAVVRLNGGEITESSGFNKQTNVLYVPVELKAGRNIISVELHGEPGQRISARIDAPPDALRLEPVRNTLSVGESLQARAILTGQGRPVRDAPIKFRVKSLGQITKRTASTDHAGVAMVTLSGFERVGKGTLTARASGVKPVLSKTVPVRVVLTPSIELGKSISKAKIEVGQAVQPSYFIDALKDDTKTHNIVFEQSVEPDRGIDVQTSGVPPGGFAATGPSLFVVKGTIEGRAPGTYTLTSRATVEETGETATAKTEVVVTEPRPAEALSVEPPEFLPAGITVSTSTQVRFATTASGVTRYPPALELQEFDPELGRWKKVPGGDLRDDGLKGDLFAGDRVYAGHLTVTGTQEGERRYRVVHRDNGKPIVSEARALEVTRFEIGPDPGPHEFIGEDKETGEGFAAEQVLVGFLPGVSSQRIEEIVTRATQQVTGKAGDVFRYIPRIGVYLLALQVDTPAPEADRVAAVKATIDELKTYDEITFAEPNFAFAFSQAPVTPDGDSTSQCTAIAPAGFSGQWAAKKIGADHVWALPGGSGGAKKVAVVDTGVKTDHPDLTGNVTGDSGDLDPGNGHGTRVAGIIAAKHNAQGITGIAYGAPVISCRVGSSFSDNQAIYDEIKAAADATGTNEVAIINLSARKKTTSTLWECSIRYAALPPSAPIPGCSGLTGGLAGKGKLVVAAAGNGSSSQIPYDSYPCKWNLDGVLCVANTNHDDHLHATGSLRSNYGTWVDLTAPGTEICSPDKSDSYSGATGTSFAVPHVSGAAAVLWSMKPGLTASEVAERLKDTADPIDGINPSYVGQLGSGRLDMQSAVDYVIDPDLTMASGSQPYLTGGTWTSIDSAQAQPAKGGLVLAYENPSFNSDAYPLNASGASVTLRPSAAASPIACTNGPPPISPGPADLGSCFFQLAANKVYIYYLGNLRAGDAIAYTVSGLTAADPDFTVADFDSGTVDGSLIPTGSRDPARLVLVLDKSGSMDWSSHPDDPGCGVYAPPPSGCEPSRWEILQDAVNQMLAVAQPYALLDDRFAVAFFDSNVSASNRLNLTGFGPAISTFVSDTSRTPGGRTSIGDGVTEFESELVTGASSYYQTILLFTDGDQNEPRYLVDDGSHVLINPTTNSSSGTGVYEFAPGAVDICPFALRADNVSGTLGTNDLETIANLRCGGLMNSAMNIAPNNPELVQFFLQVLHEALIGDKLELVKVTSGQIRRKRSASASETFTTSRDDLAFTVLIDWTEPGNGLEKIVLSKDGVNFPVTGVPSRIQTSSGDRYMAITLHRPYCRNDGKCVKSEGEWQLYIQPSFEVANTFTYNLFVTADNASLASEFRVLQSEPGVGRPLRLTASLAEAGKPIQGLPAGSVRAVLSRPKASLGNVLSKAKVKSVQTPDADPISAAGRKASAMLADPKLRPAILDALEPGIETTLILKESKPGLYEASYHDARVSGMYSVRFHVNAKSAGNGKFTRTFASSRYVETMADERLTLGTVRVSKITPCRLAGGCYAITLMPVDAAGNLLGPGKASQIRVPKFSGRILDPISDELDGRYTIRVGYPKPSLENPSIEIPGARLTLELDKLVK